MMALVDNNVSEDTVLAIRDCLRPNLMGHRYDSRNEFLDRYDDEKYKWIEKSRNPVSDNG